MSLSFDIKLILAASVIVTVFGAVTSGSSLITLLGAVCLILSAGEVVIKRGHVVG